MCLGEEGPAALAGGNRLAPDDLDGVSTSPETFHHERKSESRRVQKNLNVDSDYKTKPKKHFDADLRPPSPFSASLLVFSLLSSLVQLILILENSLHLLNF